MGIDKDRTRETIFGPEFEVVVYPDPAQHRGKISIIVHPDDKEKIKILTSNRNLILNILCKIFGFVILIVYICKVN
jgi:hypothetical protein